jgi:hypothetical protein
LIFVKQSAALYIISLISSSVLAIETLVKAARYLVQRTGFKSDNFTYRKEDVEMEIHPSVAIPCKVLDQRGTDDAFHYQPNARDKQHAR